MVHPLQLRHKKGNAQSSPAHVSHKFALSQARSGVDSKVVYTWLSWGTSWPQFPESVEAKRLDGVSQVEWKIVDVNGDGYPDIVANSQPLAWRRLDETDAKCNGQRPTWEPDHAVTETCVVGGSVRFPDNTSNDLIVFYNRGGTQVTSAAPMFAAPSVLAKKQECAVESWSADLIDPTFDAESLEPIPPGKNRYRDCGLDDVNGDGIPDRVREQNAGESTGSYADIGTGVGFATTIALPGRSSVHSERGSVCTDDALPGATYPVWRRSGFVDLTGDGIPDYYGAGRLRVGTGVSWREPVDIEAPNGFSLSSHEEDCATGSTSSSMTNQGVFDVDGDGRKDVAHKSGGVLKWYSVTPIVGGSHGVGRLVRVKNGHGAATQIIYDSAKRDGSTAHQVPFAEVVVSKLQTVVDGDAAVAESLEPTHFAYGDAHMRFDPNTDRFGFAGYGKQVVLGGLSGRLGRVSGNATIQTKVDTSGYTGIGLYAMTGRLRYVDSLDGTFNSDANKLLNLDVSADQRWHGRATSSHEHKEVTLSTAPAECTDFDPYAFNTVVLVMADGTYDWPCTKRAFAHVRTSESWRGDESPDSSDKNLQTRTVAEAVDSWGRPTMIRRVNDVHYAFDDICEDITYALPIGDSYQLGAVHTRRFRACDKGKTDGPIIAGVRYRYDGLAEGSVSLGRMTHQIVERYEISSGDKLEEWIAAEINYDVYGNVVQVLRENQTPVINGSTMSDPVSFTSVTRTQSWQEFGAFMLSARRQVVSATATNGATPATLTTSVTLDPMSMAVTASTDANGTVWRTQHDGFGRATSRTVQGAGQSGEYVVGSSSFSGFTLADLGPRSITQRTFHSALTWSDFQASVTAKQSVSVVHLDELGRQRYNEVQLGADYDGEKLIGGEVTYDSLGRVVFAADTHPASETGERYGTTTLYREDGTVRCVVRGRGLQTSASSDQNSARFASCGERIYGGHRLTLRAKGANELQLGSGQDGAYDQQVRTAMGWTLEKSRWHDGQAVEVSDQRYDRQGNIIKYTRYESPSDRSGAVVWDKSYDSLGQLLRLEEAGATPRLNYYDHWGQQYESRSDSGSATMRRTVSQHDGYGRLLRSVGVTGTSVDKHSRTERYYDTPAASEDHVGGTHLLGRLSHTTSKDRATYYGYDAFGRSAAVTRAGNNERYTQTFDYAVTGHLRGLTFLLPDNDHQPEVVHYTYDSAMRTIGVAYESAEGVEDMFSAKSIDPFGRYLGIAYGNGVADERTYRSNDRRELLQTALGTASGLRFTHFDKYDAGMRVLQRYDYSTISTNGGVKSETSKYAYDSLNRLIEAQVDNLGTLTTRKSYSYDGLGNLRQVLDIVANTTLTVDNDTTDRDRICNTRQQNGLADSFVTTTISSGGFFRKSKTFYKGGSTCDYKYDSEGSVSLASGVGATRSFEYDAQARIANMTTGGVLAKYRYDAAGAVASFDISGAGAGKNREDRRFGALIERIAVDNGSGSTYVVRRTIPGPEGVLAVRGKPYETKGVVYWHGDQQANRVFTDGEHGEVVQNMQFDPFGKATGDSGDLGSESYTNYLWNGGDAIKAFGVSHLGARIYDPVVGRFLQRDPLLIGRTSSKMHPYAFAHSDPINLSDSTGLDESLDGGGSLGLPVILGGPLVHIPRVAPTRPTAPARPNPGVTIGGGQWASVHAYTRLLRVGLPLRRTLGGSRLLGALQVLSAGVGIAAGAALCETVVGCFLGAPLVTASMDYGAAGLGRTWHNSPQRTWVGRTMGSAAQEWQARFVDAGGLAHLGVRLLRPVMLGRAGAGSVSETQGALSNLGRQGFSRTTATLSEFGEGAAFSGVFNPASGRFLATPSGTTRLASGARPANLVPRRGGHFLVEAELNSITGALRGQNIGFTVHIQHGGGLRVEFFSRSVNGANASFSGFVAPANLQTRVINALRAATGRRVSAL